MSLFKQDPNRVDLRFFRWMELSDTWSGEGIAYSGNTTDLLFYKGREVFRKTVHKYEGSTEGRNKTGDASGFYQTMSHVASYYMCVLYRARALIGRDTNGRATSETVNLTRDALNILENHPQYREMLDNFAEAGHVIQLVETAKPGTYTIVVNGVSEIKEPSKV